MFFLDIIKTMINQLHVKLAHPRYINGYQNIIYDIVIWRLAISEEILFDSRITNEITLFNLVQLPSIFKFGPPPKLR